MMSSSRFTMVEHDFALASMYHGLGRATFNHSREVCWSLSDMAVINIMGICFLFDWRVHPSRSTVLVQEDKNSEDAQSGEFPIVRLAEVAVCK
jgi:hypothetical protein